MRFYLTTITTLLILTGCGDRKTATQTTTADTPAENVRADVSAPKTYCFQQVTGRDSATVRLMIDSTSVTGELAVLPYQKDRARGPFRGTLINNQIRADWQRSGEGVTQPYEIMFTLTDDAISWREGERLEKQGKWILKNPTGGFQYVLTKTNCP